MLDLAVPSVRPRHAIDDAWQVLGRLFGRLTGTEAEDYYRALFEDWSLRLSAAAITASDTFLPDAAAASVSDLLSAADDIASREDATEEALAEWLEVLPRTILTLSEVRPVASARISEKEATMTRERLTNSADSRVEGWEPSRPSRLRINLAA
jgi:hypothetical protein